MFCEVHLYTVVHRFSWTRPFSVQARRETSHMKPSLTRTALSLTWLDVVENLRRTRLLDETTTRRIGLSLGYGVLRFVVLQDDRVQPPPTAFELYVHRKSIYS